jgi:hypothetical protein
VAWATCIMPHSASCSSLHLPWLPHCVSACQLPPAQLRLWQLAQLVRLCARGASALVALAAAPTPHPGPLQFRARGVLPRCSKGLRCAQPAASLQVQLVLTHTACNQPTHTQLRSVPAPPMAAIMQEKVGFN